MACVPSSPPTPPHPPSRPLSPVGRWSLATRLVEVVDRGGELLVLAPGVPEEVAPRLEQSGSGLVLRGGPYDGVGAELVDRGGIAHLVLGGVLALAPWTDAAIPPVPGIPVPPVRVDPVRERAYRELLDQAQGVGGDALDPPADLPRADWLRWVGEQQVVLFHGSPDGGITEFVPRRTSYELDDQADRGNRAAVYATDDPWWSLWFAVVDRDRLRGTIRSTVEDFTRPDGQRLPVYSFSVDRGQLALRPWRDGWLYVLPRASFERLPMLPGGPPSHEWCGYSPVVPLARLRVTPADFPFLDRVGAHDDGDLLRLGDLSDVVRTRVVGGRRTADGVSLRLAWDAELAGVLDDYLELGRRWMPEIGREVRRDGAGEVWLDLTAPPALAAMLRERYAEHVDPHPAV